MLLISVLLREAILDHYIRRRARDRFWKRRGARIWLRVRIHDRIPLRFRSRLRRRGVWSVRLVRFDGRVSRPSYVRCVFNIHRLMTRLLSFWTEECTVSYRAAALTSHAVGRTISVGHLITKLAS